MKALKALSRAALCLQACNGPDLVTTHTLAASMGWSTHVASTTLSQARAQGHIEQVESKLHGQSTFKITADGKRRLAQITPATTQPDDRELERRAFDMVIANANGCDSEILAKVLGSTPEHIEQLLELHVEQHRLVTCGVWRGGVTFLQYRASAGSTLVYDWSAQRLSGTTAAQKKLPITPPAPAPELSLRQQIAAKAKPAKVAAPQAEAAAPVGLVDCGECRTQGCQGRCRNAATIAEPATNEEPITFPTPSAVCGKVLSAGDTLTPIFPEGALALTLDETTDAVDEDAQGFLCALYSDGVLWIQADGRQFDLPLEYTRQLLHYLEHMRAAELVEGIAEATS